MQEKGSDRGMVPLLTMYSPACKCHQVSQFLILFREKTRISRKSEAITVFPRILREVSPMVEPDPGLVGVHGDTNFAVSLFNIQGVIASEAKQSPA